MGILAGTWLSTGLVLLTGTPGATSDPLGLLRDLHDLYVMAAACDMAWTVVGQAAKGLRDDDLVTLVTAAEEDTAIQLKWLRTRMKQAAPQSLVVA